MTYHKWLGLKPSRFFCWFMALLNKHSLIMSTPDLLNQLAGVKKKCQLSSELSPAWRGISLIHQGLLLV
jgi:hypothetical protein